MLTACDTIPPTHLDRLVSWVACFDTSSATGRREAGEIIEFLVQTTVVHVAGRARRPGWDKITMPPLATLMVELLDPKPGGRIYDPCFGTGGLLATAVRKAQSGLEESRAVNGEALGAEIDPQAYIVGAAQVALAGPLHPRLEPRDALDGELATEASSAGADYVVAHPPWGRARPDNQHAIPVATKEIAMRFLQHVMASLNPGGRAVVALPDHVLHRSGPDRETRRELLSTYTVEGVISIPHRRSLGAIPYATTGVNLLVVCRSQPASAVRFMSVPDDLRPTPQGIAVKFREGQPDSNLWDRPVRVLGERNWDMAARRTGEEALARKLTRLRQDDPTVETVPLGSIADIRAGKSYRNTLVGYDAHDAKVRLVPGAKDGVLVILRVADIHDFGVLVPQMIVYSSQDLKLQSWLPSESRPEPMRPDDILLATSGTIGKVGVLDDMDVGRAVAGHGIAVIRITEGVSSGFLKCVLASDLYQRWMRGHARGTTVQHLAIRRLRALPVPVPPPELQERVVRLVSGHRGDPFAAIVRILANTRDPVAEWLEESTEVRQLRKTEDLGDGAAQLEKIAESLRTLRNEVARPGVRTVPELSRWLETVNEPVAALEGLTDIPPGPERLAVLDGASLQLERIAPPEDPASPAIALAHDVARRISGLAGLERERLLAEVNLQAEIEPGWVAASVQSEVQVRLTNRSPLPFRSLGVFTLPKIGEARAGYLPADSKLSCAPTDSG